MTMAKRLFQNYRIIGLAILIFIVSSIVSPYFFTMSNLWGLFVAMPAYGIAAIGLTFIFITGKLDISLGSVMALTSVIFALTISRVGFIPAVLISIVSGMVLGSITGSLVAFFQLDTFIVSLSAMIAYKGIALFISNSSPVVVTDPIVTLIGNCTLGPIPITFFFFVAIVIIAQLLMTKTSFGRNLFAIGGNVKVAESVGINVNKYIFKVFVLNGGLAALGGIVLMTRLFSASGNNALDAPLTIIPMVIIGGTAFAGGRGSAFKTLCGVILMYVIFNALSMFNIYVNIQAFIQGAILLAVIVVDKYLENRAQKV
jgi:ribose transport system permease protein